MDTRIAILGTHLYRREYAIPFCRPETKVCNSRKKLTYKCPVHAPRPSLSFNYRLCLSDDDCWISQVHGTSAGGDADELRLLSTSDAYINLRAYGGSLDFLSTKVSVRAANDILVLHSSSIYSMILYVQSSRGFVAILESCTFDTRMSMLVESVFRLQLTRFLQSWRHKRTCIDVSKSCRPVFGPM